jgi:hypothetical protein
MNVVPDSRKSEQIILLPFNKSRPVCVWAEDKEKFYLKFEVESAREKLIFWAPVWNKLFIYNAFKDTVINTDNLTSNDSIIPGVPYIRIQKWFRK